MIEELVKVAAAMEKAGIVPVDWHPKLKVLPKVSKKTPCVRIWLTADGHIKDMESLTEKQAVFLRKYEPDLGKSLPGFNVRPLYRIVKSDDEMKNASRGKVGEKLKLEWIKDFLSLNFEKQKEDDFWPKTRVGLERSFSVVREDLEKLCSDRLDNGETLQKFFNVVKQIDVIQFQTEYIDVVRRKIANGDLPFSLMYYFVTKTKKHKEDSNSRTQVQKFSVVLDIVDYLDYPVTHKNTIQRLNALLMDNNKEKDSSDSNVMNQDAYGLDGRQSEEKFPSITLPFLGGVILRSQASTISAQKRYHQCESNTFPVGAETRKRVKAALEWISDKRA